MPTARGYARISWNLQSGDRYATHIFARSPFQCPAQPIALHHSADRSKRYLAAPDRRRSGMPEYFCVSPHSSARRAMPPPREPEAWVLTPLLVLPPAEIASEPERSGMPWAY